MAFVSKGWLATWAVIVGVSAAACNAPASHADTIGDRVLLGFGPHSPIPADEPGLTCEHRGLGHLQAHGGKAEDDAYHRLHHERTTCDGKDEPKGDFAPYEHHDEHLHADEPKDDQDKDKRHDDSALIPGHRDKPGYGCFMLRCG